MSGRSRELDVVVQEELEKTGREALSMHIATLMPIESRLKLILAFTISASVSAMTASGSIPQFSAREAFAAILVFLECESMCQG